MPFCTSGKGNDSASILWWFTFLSLDYFHPAAEDVVGGMDRFGLGLKTVLHRMAMRFEAESGTSFFSSAPAAESTNNTQSNLLEQFVAVGSGTSKGDDE